MRGYGKDDREIIALLAESHGWKLVGHAVWDDDGTPENLLPGEPTKLTDFVDAEPTNPESTEVWHHSKVHRTLVIHYDWRYLFSGPGSHESLQPVFWKTWEGDPSDVNGREVGGYLSSNYVARAHEHYPNPSEGLAINRRWLLGSIIDQLNV